MKTIEPIILPNKWQSPNDEDKNSPRLFLQNAFNLQIPIKGGWGYTRDDAVIIDKFDPIVSKGIPFNGVSYEYIFVEKRIYSEMIVFRAENDKFSGISWELDEQMVTGNDGKNFDVLKFKVCGTHDSGQECCYDSTYWFDITSFY